MGPKKNLQASSEDVDEIKKALDFLTEEVSTVRHQQKTIMGLVEEVKALRLQNIEQEKKIELLEQRVADLEQYSRINDIIISGLDIKPRSYAHATSRGNGAEVTEEDSISVEGQVSAFLKSHGIELDTNNIEACHLLPRRRKRSRGESNEEKEKPALILRFVNRKHKTALLKQGRLLKGTNVYMNENLTKRNGDIAREARALRKKKKIQSTWTLNCKVFIKLNGTPEEAKVILIRNMEEFDKYNVK